MRGPSIVLGVTACVLSACATPAQKPFHTALMPAPLVAVERVSYVRIDPVLTEEHPIAEGALSACPIVAAERKAELVRCNAKLGQIREIEGTEKPQ